MNRIHDRKQHAIEEARLQQNVKTFVCPRVLHIFLSRCIIKCNTCESVIGQSTMMRTILNHNYVLCNTDIWNKIVLIPQKKIKVFFDQNSKKIIFSRLEKWLWFLELLIVHICLIQTTAKVIALHCWVP